MVQMYEYSVFIAHINVITLNKQIPMKTLFHPAHTRGGADYGWLKAQHSFSFGSWFDPGRIQFGALRVWNDDWVAPGTGFSKHPHNDMEIITITLEGRLRHRDNLGSEGEIRAGEVQVMSAGTGIEHSEINPDPRTPLRLFQIWIFPDQQGHSPRYDQRAIPMEAAGIWTELAGPMGHTTGLEIHQQARIRRIQLEPGQTADYTLEHAERGVYAMVVDGTAAIGEQLLNTRDAIGIFETPGFSINAQTALDVIAIEVPLH